MQRVRARGRVTAFRREDRGGEEPPLLCVHGSGGDHRIWRAQSRLADGRPVVSLDLSGHGASDDVDAAPGFETLSAYAGDVVTVARETGARVLVGNSLGGAVALWVALERDLPLDGLVLAGTGARLVVPDDLLTWLATDFDRAVEYLHGLDRLFHEPNTRTLEVSREALYATGRAVVARDFRTSHAFDVRGRLEEVTVPALAIGGEHDRLTPPWYHEYLADELPNCDLAIVDGAAHLAMLEVPGAFNAALDRFLDSLPAGSD